MPRRFARVRGRSGKPVHPTTWCSRDVINTTHSAAGTLETIVCGESALEQFTNPTIVRIRGVLWVTLSYTSTDVSLQADLALGLKTAPVGSPLVSLLTEDGLEQNWMWLDYVHMIDELHLRPRFTSAGAFVANETYREGRHQTRINIDVKTMRRITGGRQNVVLHSTMAEIAAAPDVAIRGIIRTLVKE